MKTKYLSVILVILIKEHACIVGHRVSAFQKRWVPMVTAEHFVGPLSGLDDLHVPRDFAR